MKNKKSEDKILQIGSIIKFICKESGKKCIGKVIRLSGPKDGLITIFLIKKGCVKFRDDYECWYMTNRDVIIDLTKEEKVMVMKYLLTGINNG